MNRYRCTVFRLSQRCCNHAATLARVVLLCSTLLLAGCSGSTTDPDPGQSGDATPPTTDPSSANPDPIDPDTIDPASTDPGQAPTSDVPKPGAGPEQSDLSIAEGLPGLIARRTGDGDLVISAPDGSGESVWGQGSQSLSNQPTWSRNGSMLAWSLISEDGPGVAWVSIDGGPDDVEMLSVRSPAFYLSWSPDDRYLAGLRNSPTGIELAMVDTESGELTVVGPGQPFFTDWMSNDSLIAAVAGAVLADFPADMTDSPVQRSLDSRLGVFQAPIALVSGDVIIALEQDGANELVRLSGEEATSIARADGPISMSIDPLGERLAVLVGPGETELELISFQTDRALPTLESGRVSIIDLGTGAVETRPETNIVAINWSPTGSHLAMLEVGTTVMTWLFAEAGSDPVRGVPFIPSNEFANSYVPFADQYDRSSTWWSPDGTAFVFAGIAYGEPGIWIDRIDDTNGPALLGSGDIAFWSK